MGTVDEESSAAESGSARMLTVAAGSMAVSPGATSVSSVSRSPVSASSSCCSDRRASCACLPWTWKGLRPRWSRCRRSGRTLRPPGWTRPRPVPRVCAPSPFPIPDVLARACVRQSARHPHRFPRCPLHRWPMLRTGPQLPSPPVAADGIPHAVRPPWLLPGPPARPPDRAAARSACALAA